MTSPQLPMDPPSECLLPGPHHSCRHSHCVIVFVSVALIVMPFVCMLCPVRSPWLAARWQILKPGKGSQLTKCSGCLWCTVHSSKASSVVLTWHHVLVYISLMMNGNWQDDCAPCCSLGWEWGHHNSLSHRPWSGLWSTSVRCTQLLVQWFVLWPRSDQ